MARIKGASIADQAAHRIYDEIVLPSNHGGLCARCGGKLITAYHEERLYSVRCKKCETLTLTKAGDPYKAEEKVSAAARPAEKWDKLEMAKQLMDCWPGSYIYRNGEFIAHERSNTYLCFENCETLEDLRCKVLEWFSRAAHKTEPYHTEKSNKKFHQFMLDGINKFLGTAFDFNDMDLIYTYLGNAVHHDLTAEFVRSGYDMSMLYERQGKECPWTD